MQGVKPTDVYQKQSGPFSYKYPQLLDNERTFFCFIKLNHWRGRKSSWASGTQALPGLDSLFLYLYFSLSVSLIFSDQTPPCQKHGGLQFLESLFLHPRKGTKFVPSELRLKNPRKDFRLVQLGLLTTLRGQSLWPGRQQVPSRVKLKRMVSRKHKIQIPKEEKKVAGQTLQKMPRFVSQCIIVGCHYDP